MTHHDDHLHDAEFGPVIDRLRAERPTASALELDTIKQRVRGRVARAPGRSRRTEFMRSRLAILGMLVLGLVLSSGGAGMAVSGLSSGDRDAATAQYGRGDVGPQGDVLGEEDSGGRPQAPAGQEDDEGGRGDVQPARQVALGAQDAGSELPFTGFLAIPVLLSGVALLATGLVLRRRAREDE